MVECKGGDCTQSWLKFNIYDNHFRMYVQVTCIHSNEVDDSVRKNDGKDSNGDDMIPTKTSKKKNLVVDSDNLIWRMRRMIRGGGAEMASE